MGFGAADSGGSRQPAAAVTLSHRALLISDVAMRATWSHAVRLPDASG